MSSWGQFGDCEKFDRCQLDERCDLYLVCSEVVEAALDDPPAETPPDRW